jgi:hypothetical protein
MDRIRNRGLLVRRSSAKVDLLECFVICNSLSLLRRGWGEVINHEARVRFFSRAFWVSSIRA